MAAEPSTTAAPVERVKSSSSHVSEYRYPHGHLHHLNQHEEEQLREFKALIQEKGLYEPGPAYEDFILLCVTFFSFVSWPFVCCDRC